MDEESMPLEIIRSIQTVEDFKEKKDAIFDGLEKIMRSNLKKLIEIQDKGLSLEENTLEIDNFYRSQEAFGMEMEKEFNRLDTIPGLSEYAESIRDELFKRTESLAKEGEEIMKKLSGEGAGRPHHCH